VATLILEPPGQAKRSVKVHKALTTIGADAENDIALGRAGLEPTHAQITKEADGWWISALAKDLTINGRREKRRRLAEGDVLRLGELTLTFLESDPPAISQPPSDEPAVPSRGHKSVTATREVVTAYRRIYEFSVKLMANAGTGALVETLLDSVIELTGADKGFLVLVGDEQRPEVAAARGVERSNLDPSVAELSDSILKRVFESKKPIVVADALRDEAFNASASVVNLKLLSVMCCPLLLRDEILGAIYVGNNRVAHVFDEAALEVMSVFAAEASLLLSQERRAEELRAQNQRLEGEIDHLRFGRVIGACDSMKEIYKRIRKVATTDVAVLITGETGTGKELVAREIHENSRRARGPFVVINCGAIPENLLESELFGHVRGAFTGAVATKLGKFQAANEGTLFLDEIGEMPALLQVKILRALQEHVVMKVGDTKPERVDIRVLAATNRVLEEEIKAGRFRDDLYYRLNVVQLHLPPLRERGDDLPIIAKYLLGKTAKEQGRTLQGFSKACLAAIRVYPWPGNIRQLENRIKKAVVLSDGPLISAEDMDLRAEDVEEILPLADARARFETRYIQEVLDRCGQNRTQTARVLGVDPRTIFRHLARLQSPIPPETGELGLEAADDDDPPRP